MEENIKVGVDASGAVTGARVFTRSTDAITASAARATKSTQGLTAATTGLSKATTILLRLLPALGGAMILTSAIKQMTTFEQTMKGVQAVTNVTAEGLSTLSAKAREMGAKTSFSATEAAEGMRFLGMAGFSANQILEAIPATLDLARAGMLGLGRAADIVSNIMSGFGAKASQTTEFVDVLAATAASSNTDIEQLGEAMKYAAPVAHALGLSVQETAAYMGLLGNAGLQGSLGGTGLRIALMKLLDPTDKATDALKVMGLTVDQVNPELHSMEDIIKTLSDANLSAGAATELFGARGAGAMLVLANSYKAASKDGSVFANQLDEQLRISNEADGAARRMADTMQDNLWGRTKELTSAISELYLQMGDGGLLGGLTSIVIVMRDFTRGMIDMNSMVSETEKQFNSAYKAGEAFRAGWDAITASVSALLDVIGTPLGAALAVIAAGLVLLPPLLLGVEAAFWRMAAAATASAASLSLVQLAIWPLLALVAGFKFGEYLYNEFETVRKGGAYLVEGLMLLGSAFEYWFDLYTSIVQTFSQWITDTLSGVVTWIGEAITKAAASFRALWTEIGGLNAILPEWVIKFGEGFIGIFTGIYDKGKAAITDLFEWIAGFLPTAQLAVTDLIEAVANWGSGASPEFAAEMEASTAAFRARNAAIHDGIAVGIAATETDIQAAAAAAAATEALKANTAAHGASAEQLAAEEELRKKALDDLREFPELAESEKSKLIALKDALDPIAAAHKDWADNVIFLTRALKDGSLTQAEFDRYISLGEAARDKQLAQLTKQATQVDKLTTAYTKLHRELDPGIKLQEEYQDKLKTIAEYAKAHGGLTEKMADEVRQLATEYDAAGKVLKQNYSPALKQVMDLYDKAKKAADPLAAATEEYHKQLAIAAANEGLLAQEGMTLAEVQSVLAKGFKATVAEIEEAKRKADPFAVAWEEAVKRIDEAFFNLWESAFSGMDDFLDAAKDALKTFAAQTLHNLFTKPLADSVSGMISGGGSTSAGGGMGGLTNLMSMGKSVLGFGKTVMGGFSSGGLSGGLDALTQPFLKGVGNLFGGVTDALGMTLAPVKDAFGNVLMERSMAGTVPIFDGAGNVTGYALGGNANWFQTANYNMAQLPGGALGGGLITAGAGMAGGYLGNKLGEGLTGRTATQSYGQMAGGLGGAYIGAQAGMWGGPIGAAIGAGIGALIDVAFGTDDTKRQRLGVIAGTPTTGTGIGEAVKATSGLSLQPVARRASQESADAMLEIFQQIDTALVGMSASLGATIDLTNKTLVNPLFVGSKSAPSNFFGDSEDQKLRADRIEAAPADFFKQWLNTVKGEFDDKVKPIVEAFIHSAETDAAKLITQFGQVTDLVRLRNQDSMVAGRDAALETLKGQDATTNPAFEALTTTTKAIMDSVGGLSVLTDDLTEFNNTLALNKAAIAEVAAQYVILSSVLKDTFAKTRTDIEESLLSTEQLYEKRRTQMDDLFVQLQATTDPAKIGDLVAKINQTTTDAFGMLDESQRAAMGQEFLTFLDQAEALSQKQVDWGNFALGVTQNDIDSKVQDRIDAATAAQTTAAAQQEAAAGQQEAAGSMNAAAELFGTTAAALSALPADIQAAILAAQSGGFFNPASFQTMNFNVIR